MTMDSLQLFWNIKWLKDQLYIVISGKIGVFGIAEFSYIVFEKLLMINFVEQSQNDLYFHFKKMLKY